MIKDKIQRFTSGIKLANPKELRREPGNYRWWATKDITSSLLGEYFDELDDKLTTTKVDDQELYLVYVGESLNLKRRISNYLLGTGTFAKTIKSLGQDIGLIKKLFIEFQYCENRPGPTIAKIEAEDLYYNNVPLNIKSNKQSLFESLHNLIHIKRKDLKQLAGK